MLHALTLQLATDQVVHVSLTEPAHLRLATALVLERARLQHRSDELSRTYHLGDEATPGLAYDDRLTVRLKSSTKTIYKLLALAEKKGGLRNYRVGRDYRVTEQAVRDFQGEHLGT